MMLNLARWLPRWFARGAPVLSEADTSDSSEIAELHAASFQRGWSDNEIERLLLERNTLAHRAAAGGGALLGFIMSRRAGDEAEILSIAVTEGARGRGLARMLLDLHMRRLAGLGVRAVFLEVDEDNEPAQRLYRRAGYREVGRRAGYYRKGSGQAATALTLRRDLN
jgi:[ribosomal protein S18]-alanine N-acetyltransferase